jgi:serine/threonine protein phosphatase 1
MKRRKPRASTVGRTPPGTVIYGVGDIHGRVDLLHDLHDKIRRDAVTRDADDIVVVYIGDYIDRGPRSREVIDLLIQGPLLGGRQVFLLGNHEQAMLGFLDGDRAIGEAWIGFGGLATLASYSVPMSAASPVSRDLAAMQEQLLDRLPSEHLAFLKRLERTFVCGSYLFVHAGIRLGRALATQNLDDLLWIRDEFHQSTKDHGYIVVHGHSIVGAVEFTKNRIAIDTGAYATGTLSCIVLESGNSSVLRT